MVVLGKMKPELGVPGNLNQNFPRHKASVNSTAAQGLGLIMAKLSQKVEGKVG